MFNQQQTSAPKSVPIMLKRPHPSNFSTLIDSAFDDCDEMEFLPLPRKAFNDRMRED